MGFLLISFILGNLMFYNFLKSNFVVCLTILQIYLNNGNYIKFDKYMKYISIYFFSDKLMDL